MNIRIGVTGIVGIVFIVLKLTGVIGWSWWWVTSPLWVGFALSVISIVLAFLFAVTSKLIEK